MIAITIVIFFKYIPTLKEYVTEWRSDETYSKDIFGFADVFYHRLWNHAIDDQSTALHTQKGQPF